MTTGYINIGMGDVGVSFRALLAVVTYIHYWRITYIYKCGFIAGQVLVISIYSWDIVSQKVCRINCPIGPLGIYCNCQAVWE